MDFAGRQAGRQAAWGRTLIRVLLVDDEVGYARMARRALARATGPFPVILDDCRSASAALGRLAHRRYDAVLIDGVLDDLSGIELGQRIRALGHSSALILVTGRLLDPEHERAAFAAGFDDFVRKPFDPTALRLRIAAVVRRCATASRPATGGSREQLAWNALRDAALEVRLDEPLAIVQSRPVELTPLEWRLLRCLYAHRGTTVERERLFDQGWGDAPTADPDKALDKHMRALRVKLGDPEGDLIQTIRACGFRLHFDRNAIASE